MTDADLASRIRQAIADEPELPGAMPDEMYRTLVYGGRDVLEECLRIVVRKTKQGIIDRLTAQGILP